MGSHLPGVRCSRALSNGSITIRRGTSEWQSRLIDVSLSGIRATLPETFDTGARGIAEIEINGELGERVVALARVTRATSDSAAFRFEQLSAPNEAQLRELIRHGRLCDYYD